MVQIGYCHPLEQSLYYVKNLSRLWHVRCTMLGSNKLITGSNVSRVIDKNKIRREKQIIRAELRSKSVELPLQCLYLDGSKDDTTLVDLAYSKRFRRVENEEHYTLIQEPGSVCIGHVTPSSGSSEDIAKPIWGNRFNEQFVFSISNHCHSGICWGYWSEIFEKANRGKAVWLAPRVLTVGFPQFTKIY